MLCGARMESRVFHCNSLGSCDPDPRGPFVDVREGIAPGLSQR